MNTPREEQIRKLTQALYDFQFAGGTASDTAMAIYDMIHPEQAPPAPPEPEVVVSEEARLAFYTAPPQFKCGHKAHVEDCRHCQREANDGFAAAFPLLLRNNQWAVDHAIRDRIMALPGKYLDAYGRHRIDINGAEVARGALLTALGVAP